MVPCREFSSDQSGRLCISLYFLTFLHLPSSLRSQKTDRVPILGLS